MLRNYIKIAWRNLIRNKATSFLNIFGLAIGITTCLVIMLYVYNELSYDRYNEKADQIVRVVFRGVIGGGEMKEANVMAPVARTLKSDFPEVISATRIQSGGSPLISYGEKTFKETDLAFADSNFFEVFTVPLIKGDPATALKNPNSIVVSKETAEKYFGDQDPLGKVLNFKSWTSSYKITGVYDKIPSQSHFHFNMIGSLVTNPDERNDSWMTSGYFTYLVLPRGYDYKELEAKLPAVIDKYAAPQINKAFGMNIEEFRKKGNQIGLYLQPITDIHLRSDLNGDLASHGDISYIYIFSAIALFMLLIACINFMNLSTASASKRSREVGIRKVMGSLRSDVIRQFLVESLLITTLALLIGLGFLYLVLPVFNEIAASDLSLTVFVNIWTIPILLVFVMIVGGIAGSYPAFFLSSFKPVAVLKGAVSTVKSSGLSLRSSLVVFQFFISVVLIISTLVVHNQLSYIQNKKLGYDKEQLLVVENTWQLRNGTEAFKNELLKDPRVQSISNTGFLPAGNTNFNNFSVYPEGKVNQYVKTPKHEIDYEYLKTMGIELSKGRNFSPDFKTDSSAAIINETAARALGWPNDAVGHKVVGMVDNEGTMMTYNIIGVVKDFHFKPLHESITPMIMMLGGGGNLIVKFKADDASGLIALAKSKWTSEEPFVYSFIDERYNKTYQAEQRVGNVLNIFAGLTIFVACLGLFGLATFTAQQRIKEIGIRKVLGASVIGITGMLSKDFIKLVLIAIVLAAPVAWYITSRWLEDFAYRVDLSWSTFIVSGLSAVIIAVITVSFQAIKASLTNPVKSLRSE
ncbi:MAG: ABC transporter permease [Bacteroidota bacterium]